METAHEAIAVMKAEIERRIADYEKQIEEFESRNAILSVSELGDKQEELRSMLSFVNALKMEKKEVDLDAEIDKWQAEHPDFRGVAQTADHFYRICPGKQQEKYADSTTHLLCETVQEITLAAWPVIYGDGNKYDQDSRMVMQEIRGWAEEFENWWNSHDEDWREKNDFVIEVEAFTERKCREYLDMLGVDSDENNS